MMRLLKVLLVMTCLVSVPAWAANYYVDNAPGHNGNDSNGCTTEALPCLTVQGAVNRRGSGSGQADTIFIKAGTYTGTVVIANGGSSGNPFTIRNFPGATPTLSFPNWQGGTVEAIFIGTSSTTQITDVTIDGLRIYNGYNGLKINNGTRIIVRNNIIEESQNSAILAWCYQCTADRNIFLHNGYNPASIPASSYSFYIEGQQWRITNNVMIGANGTHIQIKNAANAAGKATANHYGFGNALIANNTIAYARWQGIIFWVDAPGPGVSTGNIVRNNIFYENYSDATWNVGGVGSTDWFGGTVLIDHNVVYATGGRGTNIADSNPDFNTSGGNRTGNPNLTFAPATYNASFDGSLTSTSTQAIDYGLNVGMPFNGSAPDAGAFESFGCSAAVASGNFVDVTCQMSLNVPIQPASGQTTWVVKFSGTPRTTVSAIKLAGSDSVARITFDGAACADTDVMTVDFTSGTVKDSALIGGTGNQKLFSFTGLAVNESACTGGGGPPPPSGPEIVYDMNGISGTTVPDTSGNANDGTTTGSPTVVTGLIDDALSFADQVDDFVTAPWGSGLDPTAQSATVCILVSPDSTINSRTYMGPPPGDETQYTYLSNAGGTWSIGIQTNPASTNNEFPVQAGWSFPCIVFDASTDTATLWVNAVKGTSSESVKSMTSFTWAGNWTFGKANGFFTVTAPGGDIDHVVVYESALNQAEMTDLYESLINPSPPPSGTISIAGGRFMSPRRTVGGGIEYLAAINTTYQVRPGGYFAVDFQIDGENTDPDPFSARLHYETDASGSVFAVPDTAPENGLQFYGTTTDVSVAVDDTIDYSLTGSFDIINGSTQVTSAAIPSVDLDVDTSTVLRYILRVPTTATPGTEHCLKLLNQSGQPLGSHTPASGLCLTVSQPSASGF